MKYESIKQSLHRVSSLLAECEQSGMSAIERDLILNELREIYTEVKFGGENREAVEKPSAEPLPAPVMEPDPTEEPETEPEIEVEIITCDDTDEAGEPEETETELETETVAEPETVNSFFKSDEETQSRRRMFVHSLYSETPSATSEPQNVASEGCGEETVEVAETVEETTDEVEATEQTENNEPFSEPTETEAVAVPEEPIVAEPESEPEPEQFEPASEPALEPAAEPEPVEAVEEPVAEEVEEHHFVSDTTEHVLGEVINADVQTFADTLHPAESAAVDFVGKSAIGSLTEAIGINDRFLLIRDLFDGNAEAFDAAVEKLNSFDNLDDCMVHIVENYEWNPYSEGAKLMMALIERRYAANRQ